MLKIECVAHFRVPSTLRQAALDTSLEGGFMWGDNFILEPGITTKK
jgi:hypothetical protein